MVRNYLGNMKMEIVILFGIFETFEKEIPSKMIFFIDKATCHRKEKS